MSYESIVYDYYKKALDNLREVEQKQAGDRRKLHDEYIWASSREQVLHELAQELDITCETFLMDQRSEDVY